MTTGMTEGQASILEERIRSLRELIDQRLRTLEDKLDAMARARSALGARIDELEECHRVDHEDHETRLIELERWRWLLVGMASLMIPLGLWAIQEIITYIW